MRGAVRGSPDRAPVVVKKMTGSPASADVRVVLPPVAWSAHRSARWSTLVLSAVNPRVATTLWTAVRAAFGFPSAYPSWETRSECIR